MKTCRAVRGPFSERPYYEIEEIERICIDELRAVSLYPVEPKPIRIERFIEKRFGIHPRYEELPEGILGFSEFGVRGLREIVIAKSLAEEATKVSERRVNTTLAHEAGHGLLHAHLFALGASTKPLFDNIPDSSRILCRNDAAPDTSQAAHRGYDGRWWEFQANRAMGALLLPRPLIAEILGDLLMPHGAFGTQILAPTNWEQAVQVLAAAFDVNPAVARIRLGEIYSDDERQLTL